MGPSSPDFAGRAAWLTVEADGRRHAGNGRDRAGELRLTARSGHVLRFWNTDIMQQIACVTPTPLHPRSARLAPDEGGEAHFPQAGKGDVRS
ncbi:DUF559 domain-containing protein [Methylobacterium goesingense]|uniref:DUF559 domain-containing protein n=1 Tax=Methylobacterium TaxID=407 RepID=UPI0009E9F27F|nr:DUF559 domain-containing protein [Methylobacterium goesingense]